MGGKRPDHLNKKKKRSEAALIEVGQVLVPVYLVIIACFLIYKFSKIVPPARFFFDAVFYHVPIIGGTIRQVGVDPLTIQRIYDRLENPD